mgnify:CR=1 FL=1
MDTLRISNVLPEIVVSVGKYAVNVLRSKLCLLKDVRLERVVRI